MTRAPGVTPADLTVWLGPAIGPTLGGYIVDHYHWAWIFFINVPIGIVCTAGLWLMLDPGRVPARKFDAAGFAYIAIGLAAMQLMLDRGTQKDWFDSTEIVIESLVAAIAFYVFLIHSLLDGFFLSLEIA